MEKLNVWLLVAICAALFITCDFLAANWGKTGNLTSIVIASTLAPTSYIFFGYLSQKVKLGIASSLVSMGIVIGSVLLGYFYFKETLGSSQIIGLILAVVAIRLLSL